MNLRTVVLTLMVSVCTFTSRDGQAAVYTMSTDLHPVPSMSHIEIYLGPPPPDGSLIYQSIDVPVSGTVSYRDDFTFFGVPPERLVIGEMNLQFADIPTTTVDLGIFGTIDVTVSNLHVVLAQTTAEIDGNTFSITPGGFQWFVAYFEIDSGIVALTNPTGAIAGLLPDGMIIDYAQEPRKLSVDYLRNEIDGTFDEGPGGYTSSPELNVGSPTFPLDFMLDKDLGTIRFVTELHFASVPEVGALHLSCMAALSAVVGLCRRRTRIA